MPDGSDSQEYFANKQASELVGALDRCERNWRETAKQRGLWNLWRLINAQVFGMNPDTGANETSQLNFAGPTANYVRFRIQLTRGQIQQRNQMAQGQRPSFTAIASNNDVASLAQVNVAAKSIDYVLRKALLEQVATAALESNGYFGAGHIHLRWAYDGGSYVDVEEQVTDPEGNPMTWPDPTTGGEVPMMRKTRKKSGAPKLGYLRPWQLVQDPYEEQEHSWCTVKEVVSKELLAGEFKEHALALRGLNNISSDNGDDALFAWGAQAASSDMCILRHFYHRNCAAVPGGRYVGIAGDTILWDLQCPLDDGLPVESIISGKYFGTSFGFPESSDLLSMQQMLDEIYSQCATALMRFGNPNLWAEDGVDFNPEDLARGGAFFTLPPGKKPPVVLQYAEMPGIAGALMDYLLKRMDDVSGLNPTVRGQPDANITSGTFAALMVNVAEKFQSAAQMSYDFALNGIANKSLEFIRKNATNGFAAEVAGVGNTPYVKYFERDALNGIERIEIQRQNPVLNTIPGRWEVLNALRQFTSKDERKAASEVLLTGNIDAFVESDQSCALRIRKENEDLLMGRPTQVLWTDDPKLHVPEHIMQLNKLLSQPTPDSEKEYQAWVQQRDAHLAHIDEHGMVWQSLSPVMAAMAGLPMPPMPGAPPPPDPHSKGGANPGSAQSPGMPESKQPGLPEPAQPPDNLQNPGTPQ